MSTKLPKALIKELDELMRQLLRGNADERGTAMTRLLAFEQAGKISLGLLTEMAENSNPTAAMYAIGALGRNGHSDAVKQLLALASRHREGNPLLLETVVDALGEAGSKAATPVLLGLIGTGGSWKNRLMGKISRRKESSGANEERFRAYMLLPVMRAIEKIGDPKAAEAIGDFLEHKDPLVRCHAIRTFMNSGVASRSQTLQKLADSDPIDIVKELAAIALSKLSPLPEHLNN